MTHAELNPGSPLEARLEKKYAGRSLKFTTSLDSRRGRYTFGLIDGMVFRFSIHPSRNSMTVGVLDPEATEARFAKSFGIWSEQNGLVGEALASGEIDEDEANWRYYYLELVQPTKREYNGTTDNPDEILFSAIESFRRPTAQKVEDFTDTDVESIFIRMVESLKKR